MKLSRSVLALASASAVAMLASSTFAQVMSCNATELNSTVDAAGTREFVVNVNLTGMTGAVGAQTTLAYDSTKVDWISTAAGDDFSVLIYNSNNAVSGKVTFATGVDAAAGAAGITAGNIAKVTFRTKAAMCSNTTAVVFGTSTVPSRVTDATGFAETYTESNNVSLTSLSPFSLAGVPGARSVAADAGTTSGSLQSFTSPTASDSCGTALTVNFSRSDTGAAGDYYPIGATTITWSATDAAGNSASNTTLVTVANHQLLDASLSLNGSFAAGANSTRSIRIKAGASTQLVNFSMTDGAGSAANIQIPVAASYSCLSAKDAGHSLTNSGAATVSGVKYASSLALTQGDSNDDDLVDILDFGIYVGDFGAALAGGTSNFNDDTSVSSADYGFISLSFFSSGTPCGAFTGGNPRSAVSVRELRRSGLGHLAGSDLNGDGMLDIADIVWFLQNGVNPRPVVAPSNNTSW